MQRPGAWVDRRWWYQEGIDLAGARERAESVADGEEEGGRRDGAVGGNVKSLKAGDTT